MRGIFVALAVAMSLCVAGNRQQAVAQPSSSRSIELPASARLSDVEIRWQSDGGDGCANVGGCSHFQIIFRGDGFVELRSCRVSSSRPKPAIRRRSIDPSQIVELINELFKARFLEPHDQYGVRVAVQKKGRRPHVWEQRRRRRGLG